MFFEQPFETAPKKKRNKVIWDKSEESDDEFIRKDNVEQPFETAPKKKKNKVIQDKSEENDETSNKRSIRSSNKQQKIKNQYNLLKQWTKVIAKEEMKLKNLFFEKWEEISNTGAIDTCKRVSFYVNFNKFNKRIGHWKQEMKLFHLNMGGMDLILCC